MTIDELRHDNRHLRKQIIQKNEEIEGLKRRMRSMQEESSPISRSEIREMLHAVRDQIIERIPYAGATGFGVTPSSPYEARMRFEADKAEREGLGLSVEKFKQKPGSGDGEEVDVLWVPPKPPPDGHMVVLSDEETRRLTEKKTILIDPGKATVPLYDMPTLTPEESDEIMYGPGDDGGTNIDGLDSLVKKGKE